MREGVENGKKNGKAENGETIREEKKSVKKARKGKRKKGIIERERERDGEEHDVTEKQNIFVLWGVNI